MKKRHSHKFNVIAVIIWYRPPTKPYVETFKPPNFQITEKLVSRSLVIINGKDYETCEIRMI